MPRARRLLAALLIATVLGTGMPDPPEAHADDTAWIVIGSIVGYFSVVILATFLLRSTDRPGFEQIGDTQFAPGLEPGARAGAEGEVRFGQRCATMERGPALVCW